MSLRADLQEKVSSKIKREGLYYGGETCYDVLFAHNWCKTLQLDFNLMQPTRACHPNFSFP